MMIRAYDKFFLPCVMKNLGFTVDFAVNGCGVSADIVAADSFVRFDRTPEYWAGWILAYYQWETNLHNLRKASGLTQKELSELAGVNLRTLQQYEIGSKDINKASGQTINSLARALHCNFYDVMELVLE